MINPWQQLSQNLKFVVNQTKAQIEENIESITEGALPPYLKSMFSDLASANLQNAQILYNFLLTGHIKQNLALRTSLNHMQILCYFNRYLAYKPFERITKDDVLSYLASLRRPETDDPTHKWIGTYNVRQMILNKFFRWLYNQNEGDSKKWITPPCMQGIRQLSKKEKSPYKPSDIWNNKEHAIFLKYCSSKRDRCYHSMAYDTSARPKEPLSLKIKTLISALGDIKDQKQLNYVAKTLYSSGVLKTQTIGEEKAK